MADTRVFAEALATRKEVAAYLKVAARTMEQWGYRGIGPKYTRVYGQARYDWNDVRSWLAEQEKAGGGAAA